jgi:hypothetical protein
MGNSKRCQEYVSFIRSTSANGSGAEVRRPASPCRLRRALPDWAGCGWHEAAGVKLNSIPLEFSRSGPDAATINAIAQGETRFGTSQGGTPTSLTFSRISQFQGSIKRAGSPVGNLTGGYVTYSNNLEKIETIRDQSTHDAAGVRRGAYQAHPQILAQAYPGIGG